MKLDEGHRVSRKEREMKRHRAEILAAAERVFAECGFVSAKMEEIARESEFSVGMLYKFFKSKEELYAEILKERADVFATLFYAELNREVSAAEKIRRIFRVRVELFWQHRTFFRLFFHGTSSVLCDPRAGFSPEIWARYRAFLSDQEEVFQEGIDKGEFRPVPAYVLTMAFEGILRAFAQWATSDDEPARSPEGEEALLEVFLRGVLPS